MVKDKYCLFLHNDDYNSFTYVIYILKTMFGWDETQALNCANIAGEVGKCELRCFDDYEDALYVCKVLESKNLNVNIVGEDD